MHRTGASSSVPSLTSASDSDTISSASTDSADWGPEQPKMPSLAAMNKRNLQDGQGLYGNVSLTSEGLAKASPRRTNMLQEYLQDHDALMCFFVTGESRRPRSDLRRFEELFKDWL